MQFQIDRNTWYRGKLGSMLLRRDGKMCCLGQCAIQMEVPEDYIKMEASPVDVVLDEKTNSYLDIFTEDDGYGNLHDNNFSDKAMYLNDDLTITDEERESKLISLFKENGHELSFFN